MKAPLMHPVTKKQLDTMLTGQHHALGLSAPYGSGKYSVAKWQAEQLLGSNFQVSQIMTITPQNLSIGIDQVRALNSFIKLSFPGKKEVRRVAIIKDTEMMTIEAQNSLLRVLEEPPADLRLILTYSDTRSILSTVKSRVQTVRVLPVSLKLFRQFFGNSHSDNKVQKAYSVSKGYAGIGESLLNDVDSELTNIILYAKRLLTMPKFEQLIEIEKISKNRQSFSILLFALKRIVSTAIERQSSEDNGKLERLLRSLESINNTEEIIAKNPNSKLALTNMALYL